MGRRMQRLSSPDGFGAVRRHAASLVDRVWAPAVHRLHRPVVVASAGAPRVALITVNFSTTCYLKLMLATLAEQSSLDLLHRIIVVDNGSRDGGVDFLRTLAAHSSRVTLVERRWFRSHAHGMRAGLVALGHIERSIEPSERANFVLFCDSDVVWRNPEALARLVTAATEGNAALVGEVRGDLGREPDIQASFFLMNRAILEQRATPPLIDDGSPAFRLQRSIWGRGFGVVDFPSNHGGYILHRGRSGVAAAAIHHPRHAYARVENREPHFMGVPDGAAIWDAVEARFADRLSPSAESVLVDHLARAFAAPAGNPAERPPAPSTGG